MKHKLKAMLASRRFYAAIAAVLAIALQDLFGMSPETATGIATILSVWILGDSLDKTK